MKRNASLVSLILLVALLVMSAFYAKKMKKELTATPAPSVVVVAVPPTQPAVVVAPSPDPVIPKTCQPQKEYMTFRKDLGTTVNDHLLRQGNRKQFALTVQEWRKKNGLPLSLMIDPSFADQNQIVYNNCKSTCQGRIHQVFASQIEGGKSISILTTNGKLKKFKLHHSGLEVLTLNEVNKKGVPFKSWALPMDDGPWFISGNDIFKSLDIEGVWLKVTTKGTWSIVPIPKGKQPPRLIPTESLPVAGCAQDDLCLTVKSQKRFFRAPQVCGRSQKSND